jgi:hypothetical protein
MRKVFLAGIAAILCVVLKGQQVPNPTNLNPSVLFVGSPATTLTLNNFSFGTGAGLTALWICAAPLHHFISRFAAYDSNEIA